MYWPHFLGLFTLHNGTCVKETVQECQSTVYRSKPLPSEDPTIYKFIKMNGNYDPNYTNYDQWDYVEPEYWDEIIEWNDDGKWVCIWTCADGYVINDENNPTKCIPADACWPAKDYTNPRKQKSELCNEWWSLIGNGGNVIFGLNQYKTECSALKYEWKCTAWNKVKTCTKDGLAGVGVRIYGDYTNEIRMSSNYSSRSYDVHNDNVESDLTASIVYFSTYYQDANTSPQPIWQKTLNLKAWTILKKPLPGYNFSDDANNWIRKIQAIAYFNPVVHQKDGTDYIIYPRREQWDGFYYFNGLFVDCPSPIEL